MSVVSKTIDQLNARERRDEIYALAATGGRYLPGKKLLTEAIDRMIALGDESPLSDVELAGMVKFLQPPLPKGRVPKSEIEFTSRAAARQDARQFLMHLHWDAKRRVLEGCNGHRLHIVALDDAAVDRLSLDSDADLYLDLQGNRVKCDARWPNMDKLWVPEKFEGDRQTITIADLQAVAGSSRGQPALVQLPNNGAWVQTKLLMQACDGKTIDHMESSGGPTDGQYFCYGDYLSLIMPTRV